MQDRVMRIRQSPIGSFELGLFLQVCVRVDSSTSALDCAMRPMQRKKPCCKLIREDRATVSCLKSVQPFATVLAASSSMTEVARVSTDLPRWIP